MLYLLFPKPSENLSEDFTLKNVWAIDKKRSQKKRKSIMEKNITQKDVLTIHQIKNK